MAERSFDETVQIGIVVRDLDASVKRYVDGYGIGPWEFHEFHAGSTEDLHEHGEPVERSWRLATTVIGAVQWELIEPLDGDSDYARFLAEKGEGVHHIAVAPTNFDRSLAKVADAGEATVLSGTFHHPADPANGIRVAYLPTETDLGVILEIFSADQPR